ncbi:MAG TPA: PrsW family glutamic-type intramembrane protease [Acidobacteriaceae bacterium]|nr:PrsW family glutamic-type intramembrane protease [Acidobacteriaceae bacterium]
MNHVGLNAGELVRGALALVPVILFLAALRALDSYKLVSSRTVASALVAGALAAAVCYGINTVVFQQFPRYGDEYSRFGAPIVEESAKAVYWIFLIATVRVAFMADSAICGFAVGAGFALIENIFYLQVLQGQGVGIWIVRGFGTAIMHGGVAAIGATISAYLLDSRQWHGVRLFAPGMVAAIVLHSFFNQSVQSPVVSMVLAVVGVPLVLGSVLYLSEQSLRRWLGGKMDRDIDMLDIIGSTEFQQTRVGSYLMSLQEAFPPELRGDMLSLLQLTTELSMRAKGDLMLREAGVEVAPDPELDSLFAELRYLEKNIGPTGMLAVRPLLSQTPRDLWEMHRLGQGLR